MNFILAHEDQEIVELYGHRHRNPNIALIESSGWGDLRRKVPDALFMPLMDAERFGSRPIRNEAQVLPTHGEPGWPRFVIAGVALDKVTADDPVSAMKARLNAIIRAAKSHNDLTTEPIQSIESIAIYLPDIGFDRLPADDGFNILDNIASS